MSISIADIRTHRELVGYAYCEVKSENPPLTDENFGTKMNLKKCSDDPEEWEFSQWDCNTPKPSQSDLISHVSPTKLAEVVARFESTPP